MIKKTLKAVVLLIFGAIIIYFLSFFLQNQIIKKSLEKFNGQPLDQSNILIRCNSKFLEPEFAYIFFTGDEGHVSFDSLNKVIWKAEDWDNSYTGGTTIYKTTFDELIKMVKEDCSQFQESKGDWRKDETINWSYSPYTPPEEPEESAEPKPKRTEEELERERQLILEMNQ